MTTGRPTTYSDKMAEIICERLACGESLRTMCRKDDILPCERTVYRWLFKHEEFCHKYTRARSFQMESDLEDIMEIADSDDIKPDDKRVRIDTRKWRMGQLNSPKYGPNAKLEIGGGLRVLSVDATDERL